MLAQQNGQLENKIECSGKNGRIIHNVDPVIPLALCSCGQARPQARIQEDVQQVKTCTLQAPGNTSKRAVVVPCDEFRGEPFRKDSWQKVFQLSPSPEVASNSELRVLHGTCVHVAPALQQMLQRCSYIYGRQINKTGVTYVENAGTICSMQYIC